MEVIQEHKVFNEAWNHVKKWEGGFIDDSFDPGGKTKFGISQRQYKDVDIADITEDHAKNIAFKDYWKKLGCGYIESDEISIELFDFGFNAGVRRASLSLQRALVLIGYDVKIDGVIGHNTITAINYACVKYSKALLHGFQGYEFLHYKNIVLKNSSMNRFLKGWLARI